MIERFAEGTVRGFLHRPERAGGDGIVLAHGAGSNSQTAILVAVAGEFEKAGYTALRCDLPFRQARASGPPRPGDAARDREGLRDAAAAMRRLVDGRVYLGGHSYGGRQASMLAAEDGEAADALLLLSYPLHPPRRPENLRTAHFPKLAIPAVFVHGSRDEFGTIEEMRRALELIPAATELVEIEGAGHDLRKGGAAALALKHFMAFTCVRYNAG
jgi:predicted alpha/beta-hydrolase family hydrolase